jgi:hypothetical protein
MEMTIREVSGTIAFALLGVLCVSTVSAQQPLNPQNLPATRVQTQSCAEVNWAKDMLAQYPRIAEGCQEVVTSGGRKWARFEADLVRNNPDGTVTLNFKNRQGRSMENLTLMPVPGQRVSIGDRKYRFTELNAGQTVSVYVPEGMFAVASEPGAPPEQLAQIVTEPEPERVAQAEAAPAAQASRMPQRLPSTAGPLPLVALAGLLSALAGLGLRLRRRFFTAKK